VSRQSGYWMPPEPLASWIAERWPHVPWASNRGETPEYARTIGITPNCGGERIAQDGSPPPVGAGAEDTTRGRSGA
jgi:hypothetical protein